MRSLAVAALTVVAFAAAPFGSSAPAGATTAAVRYAAPTGAGVLCTSIEPCSVTTAVNSAPAHAVIRLEAGSYFQPSSPTTVPLGANNNPVTIVGIGGTGNDAPVINSAADPAIQLGSGSLLDNVRVNDSTTYADAVTATGGSAIANSAFRTVGTGCDLTDTVVMRDTLCLSASTTGNPAMIVRFTGGGTVTMRGVTAIQQHQGNALDISGSFNEVQGTIVATNSIFRGSVDPDVDVITSEGQTITLTLNHCDFATKVLTDGFGTVDYSASHPVAARPKFSGPNRFEEAPGSPTINAGVPDPASDRTDLDGNVRTIGKAPDIGAYEVTQKPTVSALKVAKPTVGVTTAAASVTVGAGGLATAIRYELTQAGHRGVVVKQKGGQAGIPRGFTHALKALAPKTRCSLVVTAKNVLGTARSHAVHFTTKKRPSGHHKT
jgi:hypothetical protein